MFTGLLSQTSTPKKKLIFQKAKLILSSGRENYNRPTQLSLLQTANLRY